MQSLRFTIILSTLLALAGAATVLLGPVAFAGVPASGKAWPLAAALLLTALAACVVTVLRLRRGFSAMTTHSHAMAGQGDIAALDPPDAVFQPLAGAINDCLSAARDRVDRAEGRRRETEIRLKLADAARQQAEAIIGSITDAVLVTSRFDELLLLNDAACRQLATTPDEAAGKAITELALDDHLRGHIRDVRAAGPGTRRTFQLKPEARGRQSFVATMACVGGGDNSQSVVTVLRDTTWETEVEQMKNDFISHVSHELRTPLSSIKAYVEMLLDGEADDEKTRRQFLDVVQTEANRLGRLIDDILNISRIESGLNKIEKAAVSPVFIVNEAINTMRAAATAKNQELTEHLAAALFQVEGDRDMLLQAVLNLISNAIKYTPEGGRIDVRVDVDEPTRRIIVSVKDTGLGIDPAEQPRVWEKFYRAKAGSKVAAGTGLGLPLVKQIIERVHKGKVFLSSEVGKGSTFGFELEMYP